MPKLEWDTTGERLFETGVDRGVLYIPTGEEYDVGYAWNGLTTVTESPSGAEASPQYADNVKYLNLISNEEFGCTIEAFTYPVEFGECDGTAEAATGMLIGQQTRKMFGFSYRSRIGNDVEGDALGYKIHLVYGCMAAPTERAYATVNDSPEATTFSWEITTTPVAVPGFKPTALVTLDSTLVTPADLLIVEAALYGDVATPARLPLPEELIEMLTTP
jgi:hypothetical protein